MQGNVMLQGHDIVLIASAPWRVDSRVNCHHVATRLAVDNRVLYVESPGLRPPNLLHGADRRKAIGRVRRWVGGLLSGARRISPNLYVTSPMIVPFYSQDWITRLNGTLFGGACATAARSLGFGDPILWAFLPTAIHAVGRLGESAVIYHCADDYAANPGVNAKAIAQCERRLLLSADLTFATSRPLAQRLAATTADVMCVPNVAEVQRFADECPACPAEIEALPRPVIGYVGNVASYKVDTDLLCEVARARPDWSLVLVGPLAEGDPQTDLTQLRSQNNIHLLGPRPYERIPAYVHSFDVCLIPFAHNRVTESALPLKTFEYLAAGKPVVSRPLGALVAEPVGEVVTFADTGRQFVSAIERCLVEDDALSARKRRQCARSYSWEERFPQISTRVAELMVSKGV